MKRWQKWLIVVGGSFAFVFMITCMVIGATIENKIQGRMSRPEIVYEDSMTKIVRIPINKYGDTSDPRNQQLVTIYKTNFFQPK